MIITNIAMWPKSNNPWASVDDFFTPNQYQNGLIDVTITCVQYPVWHRTDNRENVDQHRHHQSAQPLQPWGKYRAILSAMSQTRRSVVPSASAPVTLPFMKPMNGFTEGFLLNDNLLDTIHGIQAPFVHVALPMLLTRAEGFALPGDESPADLAPFVHVALPMLLTRAEGFALPGDESPTDLVPFVHVALPMLITRAGGFALPGDESPADLAPFVRVALPMLITRAEGFALTGDESPTDLEENREFFDNRNVIGCKRGNKSGHGRCFRPHHARIRTNAPHVTPAQCLASCVRMPRTPEQWHGCLSLMKRPLVSSWSSLRHD